MHLLEIFQRFLQTILVQARLLWVAQEALPQGEAGDRGPLP